MLHSEQTDRLSCHNGSLTVALTATQAVVWRMCTHEIVASQRSTDRADLKHRQRRAKLSDAHGLSVASQAVRASKWFKMPVSAFRRCSRLQSIIVLHAGVGPGAEQSKAATSSGVRLVTLQIHSRQPHSGRIMLVWTNVHGCHVQRPLHTSTRVAVALQCLSGCMHACVYKSGKS